jgi:hypothetical protein
MKTQGMTDLQVNGYAGVDFNDAALIADALDHTLDAMQAANLTLCLPTLVTADEAMLDVRAGAKRSILVTDATVAAASAGPYHFAGMRIEHSADGTVLVPGTSRLAPLCAWTRRCVTLSPGHWRTPQPRWRWPRSSRTRCWPLPWRITASPCWTPRCAGAAICTRPGGR